MAGWRCFPSGCIALVSEEGLIAEYDKILAEFAGRGLEGVAVGARPGGVSRVAVLWEGGYPQYPYAPLSVKEIAGQVAMKPLLLVHDLQVHESGVTVLRTHAMKFVELVVPLPAGQEPHAQRFRSPDLVWTRFQRTKQTEWGTIALFTSENSTDLRVYKYHWLQGFDLEGKPVGRQLDLANALPPAIQGLNWEGMSQFEKGKSLVLVHESSPQQASSLYPHSPH